METVIKKGCRKVFVGSLNQLGFLEIKATKVGEDTTLAKVVKLVEETENNKALVIRTADRWATWMVPVALLTAVLVYVATGDLIRAVTILIVFCPCALCLATPTAMMAGIGNAARKGILVKSGQAMELSGKVDAIIFDKTGTLTRGKPVVTEIKSFSQTSQQELLLLAAIAEKFSEHQLSQAIIQRANVDGLIPPDPDSFQVQLGHGVKAVYQGIEILVGNRKMEHESISLSDDVETYIQKAEEKGQIAVLIAANKALTGVIIVADPVKAESSEAVKRLQESKIDEIWMLTGDNPRTAAAIAAQTNIINYLAEQLPEQKGELVKKLKDQGYHVAMVGDGINDAPALALADVGIAMGAAGTDIAIQTADIALMSDDISKLPQLVKLSRHILKTINQNILVSMLINFVAIILASVGIMGPIMGPWFITPVRFWWWPIPGD